MNHPEPEFSRIIVAGHIPAKGMEQELEAKPAERVALAKRFDLAELRKLKAKLTLTLGREQTIAVTGEARADVMQRCVVTLEPIVTHLKIDIGVTFIPAMQNRAGAGSPHVDDPDDEFEIFYGGKIDLGEMVAQHLGITLDPYPRKPGVALGAVEFGAKLGKEQPFAKLATLTKKPKNQDKADD